MNFLKKVGDQICFVEAGNVCGVDLFSQQV